MSKVGGNANEAEEKQLWTRQASTPHARRQNATRHRVNQPAAAGSRGGGRTRAWRPAVREVAMTSDATPSSPLRDTVRAGVRDLRAVWWWFLIFFGGMHLVAGLAGPKVAWWWTQLLLGGAELVLGVWAIRSYQRSLL